MPTKLTKVEKTFLVDDGNNRGPMTMLRVRFHPKEEKLVAACADRRAAWFDLTAEADKEVKGRGKCVMGELVCPHEIGWVRSVGFSPDGNQLATGGSDRILRVWDWKDGRPTEEPARQVKAHDGWVEAVAYSPSGEQITTAGFDGLVKVWNGADLKLLQTLTGHERYVDDVAYTSDGGRLLSGGEDGRVIVWDTKFWQLLQTIDFGGANDQTGQTPKHSGVHRLAISHDDRWLGVPPEDRNKWYAKGKEGLPDTPYFSRRAILADYALTADSPLFKRAIVNRIWKQLMGRGLVEPVDQMHEANPASHTKLLNRLAEDFADHGFDLRRLMAGVLHSDTYARTSRWNGNGERPSDNTYATAILKPLTPDQLAVSVGLATGHFESMRARLEREKTKRKIDKVTASVVRAFYARDNEVRQFTSRFRTGGETFEANAGQALFLSYNPLMQKRLQASGGNLIEKITKQTENAEAVSQAFLTVLSRPPTTDELNRSVEFLSARDPPRPKLCSELVWALLCSNEFRFNH